MYIDESSKLEPCVGEHLEGHNHWLDYDAHCPKCGAVPKNVVIQVRPREHIKFFTDAVEVNGEMYMPNVKGDSLIIKFHPDWIVRKEDKEDD